MLDRIDRNEGARIKMWVCSFQSIHNHLADCIREYILTPDLNDTGPAAPLHCQQPSEIEVMSEHDVPSCTRVLHDFGIWCGCTPTSDQ